MKPTSTIMEMGFAVIAPVNTVLRKRHIQHGLNIVLLAVELTQHEQDDEAQAGRMVLIATASNPVSEVWSQTEGNAGHAGHNQQDAQRIHWAGVRVLQTREP